MVDKPQHNIQLEFGKQRNELRKRRRILTQLFWECTLRCNLRCIHCGSDCRAVERDRGEMPFADFVKVLDDVRKNINPKWLMVVTTGGEPLLRKDLLECGREITRRGFIWGMVSNGLLLTRSRLNDLINVGLKTIAVSLDGFEDEHNWMRGSRESFSSIERAIEALVDSKILWDVITCVNRRNLSTLHDFKEWLIYKGVRKWRIFTIFPAGRALEHDDLHLTGEELRQLMDFIVETREEGRINLSYSCEGFMGEYENRIRDYQFFCQAGINVASVRYDGAVSGCLSIRSNLDQGNIYEKPFSEIWKDGFEQYRDREWMHTGICEECKFWEYCEGNGMHLRGNNGELTLCNLSKMQSQNSLE